MNKVPLISIITVIYNSAENIEETLKSVIEAKNGDIEYIVIDGGSTDGTVSIIRKYEKFISFWVSEVDAGIYNAINKGIKKSTGQFIYIINCGDTLINMPIKSILENKKYDLLCFPVKLSTGKIFYPSFNNKLKVRNTLPHQGCLYKNNADLFFDERFKIFADFDLNQKYLKSKKKVKIFKSPTIANHQIDGLSHNSDHAHEIFEVVKTNFGLMVKIASFTYFKFSGLLKRIKNYIW